MEFHARGAGSFCDGLAGNTGTCRFDIGGGSTRCMPGNSSSVRTPGRRFGTTPARTRSNSSRTGWPCRLANFLQCAKRDVPLHVNKDRISRSACLACHLSPLLRKPCACCCQRISAWARMHIGLSACRQDWSRRYQEFTGRLFLRIIMVKRLVFMACQNRRIC